MSAVVSVQRVWNLEAGLARIEKKTDAHHAELRGEVRSSAEKTREELREEIRHGIEGLRHELLTAIEAAAGTGRTDVSDSDLLSGELLLEIERSDRERDVFP